MKSWRVITNMWTGNRHNGMMSEQTKKVEVFSETELRKLIIDVPNFPKEGVTFRDITPLLRLHWSFWLAIDQMSMPYLDQDIDLVAGIESRGFLFSPIALKLNAGFVPIRKEGKLPRQRSGLSYNLEYGAAGIEIHKDAVSFGQRVLIVDDVLATGGTAKAAIDLVKSLGGIVVAAQFLIELTDLKGSEKLTVPVKSVLQY